MTKRVIVCGLYRSGTTYLQNLIDRNLLVARSRGYKHAISVSEMAEFEDDVSVVLISKEIRKWINSLARQSYDLTDYYDVLYEHGHTPIELPYDDPDRPVKASYSVTASVEKLCSLYRNWHLHWGTCPSRPTCHIAYENLILSPQKTVYEVAIRIGARVAYGFTNYIRVPGSRTFTGEDIGKYLEPEYFPHLNGQQLDAIGRAL